MGRCSAGEAAPAERVTESEGSEYEESITRGPLFGEYQEGSSYGTGSNTSSSLHRTRERHGKEREKGKTVDRRDCLTDRGTDMPKVYFDEIDKRIDKLYDFIFLEMKRKKIRQKHMAAELGVTQAAVSSMLTNHTLTVEQFARIMWMLGKDITDVLINT